MNLVETENVQLYNWNDLEIGGIELNDSKQFFLKKHLKHERQNKQHLMPMDTAKADKENNKNIKNVSKNENNLNLKQQNLNSNAVVQKQSNTKLPNITNKPLQTICKLYPLYQQKNTGNDLMKYALIYEKRKMDKLTKIAEEEKRQRVFQSKPVPNFNAVHKNIENKNRLRVRTATVPITPIVLKKSNELNERKKVILEYEKCKARPNFTSKYPNVLYEEPFKPKKIQHFIDLKPFTLCTENRLRERRNFDEQIKKLIEEKKRKEEDERKRLEESAVRELRKTLVFKARPNPFK